MSVFPPALPVAVAVDGRVLAAYSRACVLAGRVYAPLSLVRLLVDRMWFERGVLVVERAGRRARVPFALRFQGNLDVSSVEVGPLLRALGDDLRFRARSRTLEIRTPARLPIASATPFAGTPPPSKSVFTPEPAATPRPLWSGTPLPRRTPLPAPRATVSARKPRPLFRGGGIADLGRP